MDIKDTDEFMRMTNDSLIEGSSKGNKPILGTIYYLIYTVVLAGSLYANQ